MRIEALEVTNLRNIEGIFVKPKQGVNWIVGGNGSGKTSILEGIFLLSRGRSFRGARHGELIKSGTNAMRVAARTSSAGRRVRIEYVRNRQGTEMYENGRSVARIRDMEGRFMVRVVGENAQSLLEGAPEIRRRFLDWNLFHVEQGYADDAARFHRVLCQRNNWLRQGAGGPAIWDEPYLALVQRITRARGSFVDAVNRELDAIARDGPAGPNLNFRLDFNPGWPQEQALQDALKRSLAPDKQRGYTYHGPQRADFTVLRDAPGLLGSRGQLKAIVCLLQLAAQRVRKRTEGSHCIWLLDDFFSELDATQARVLWDRFESTDEQIFATAVDELPRALGSAASSPSELFHVKQGVVHTSTA